MVDSLSLSFAVLCDCTQSSFHHYTLHGFCCTLRLYTVPFSPLYTAWFLLYSATVHSPVFTIIHCLVFAALCDCTQSSFHHYTLHGFCCTLQLYTVQFSPLYTAWFLLYSATVHSPVFSIIHCKVFAVKGSPVFTSNIRMPLADAQDGQAEFF